MITACAALALALPFDGYAANWLMLDASEPEDAPAFRGSMAISIEYQASNDTPLLAGAWKGQPDQFNRFAPRFVDGEVLQIPIAVAGAHGRLLDGALTYRVAGVAGDNAIVRDLNGYYGDVVHPLDASVTWNRIPHARLRVGLLRQPLGDEALAPEQRHVNLSHVTQQIVQERYFASDGSVNGDPNFDLGPVSAFRDIGAQVFDVFNMGPWEHTYALMLGNGTGVEPSLNHTGIEKYLYWSSERIFGGMGPKRDGLKLYAWSQSGERSLKVGPSQVNKEFERRRAGLGATLRTGPWSLAGEWIEARGMIYHGPDGGAIPGSISNDGVLMAGYNVLPESKANGGYVDLGYRVQEALEVRLRYDILHRGTDSANTEIQFQGVTIGGSYAFTRSDRIVIDYQFRRYEAPRLDAGSPTNVLLDGVDDRVGIRYYHQFSF
ncbi:hypothetical protein [Stutzerimonas kunmingensis]|uniref:hypothetical protein n=1 Tax=Stutzerimonas kunmingensis TaxID=1211807 RepID=UPI002105DE04|nr:hypothetical protein [Stutzerimonas kunmingensis]MCQ2036327.1 hypothetical protein [Stutzerimonas kunmingensis]